MLITTAILCGGLGCLGAAIWNSEKKNARRRTISRKSARPALRSLPNQAPRIAQTKSISSITDNHHISEYKKEIDRKVFASATSTAIVAAAGIFSMPLALLGIPGLLYASTDIIKSAWNSFTTKKKINIDVLIVIMSTACLASGFWFIAGLNIFFAMYNRKLLIKVKGASQESVINVFMQQPQMTYIKHDGAELEVPTKSLKRGDVIVVNAGETISADGYVVSGAALIDQHILTGEQQLAEVGADDKVFALTVVMSGRIEVRTEKTGQETTASQIARVLLQAGSAKTDMQLAAEKAGDKAIVPALIFSAACWPVLGAGGATAILNCHPRYKTTIATYSGLLNFLRIASEHSILIKDGRVFETLQKVDTIVFDKTGTLTDNTLRIARIHACTPDKEDDVLAWAAVAEQRQTHPIAMAILREAHSRNLSISPFDETEYKAGLGLIAQTTNETIWVGSVRFIRAEGIQVPDEVEDQQAYCQQQGRSLVVVAIDKVVVGAIELRASIREEAKAVVECLRKDKQRRIIVISGDNEAATRTLASEAGVDGYFAEVLPTMKAEFVEQLQRQGRTVCFVGDGINDAIALKKADVSVSLKGASTVATDTAMIILMDGNLAKLGTAFDLAREYDENMKATLATVLVPHGVTVVGALFFQFGLFESLIINQTGLLAGMGNAALPRIRHRKYVNET